MSIGWSGHTHAGGCQDSLCRWRKQSFLEVPRNWMSRTRRWPMIHADAGRDAQRGGIFISRRF